MQKRILSLLLMLSLLFSTALAEAPDEFGELPPPTLTAVPAVTEEGAPDATEAVPPATTEEVPPVTTEEVPPATTEEVPPAVTEEIPPATTEEVSPTMTEAVPPATTEEVPPAVTEAVPPATTEEVPPAVTEEVSPATTEEIPPVATEEPIPEEEPDLLTHPQLVFLFNTDVADDGVEGQGIDEKQNAWVRQLLFPLMADVLAQDGHAVVRHERQYAQRQPSSLEMPTDYADLAALMGEVADLKKERLNVNSDEALSNFRSTILAIGAAVEEMDPSRPVDAWLVYRFEEPSWRWDAEENRFSGNNSAYFNNSMEEISRLMVAYPQMTLHLFFGSSGRFSAGGSMSFTDGAKAHLTALGIDPARLQVAQLNGETVARAVRDTLGLRWTPDAMYLDPAAETPTATYRAVQPHKAAFCVTGGALRDTAFTLTDEQGQAVPVVTFTADGCGWILPEAQCLQPGTYTLQHSGNAAVTVQPCVQMLREKEQYTTAIVFQPDTQGNAAPFYRDTGIFVATSDATEVAQELFTTSGLLQCTDAVGNVVSVQELTFEVAAAEDGLYHWRSNAVDLHAVGTWQVSFTATMGPVLGVETEITVVNRAPQAVDTAPLTTAVNVPGREKTTYTLNLQDHFADPDAADALTFEVKAGSAYVEADGKHLCIALPQGAADGTVLTVEVIARDAHGETAEKAITLTLEDFLTRMAGLQYTVDAEGLHQYADGALTKSVADEATLTYRLDPASPALAWYSAMCGGAENPLEDGLVITMTDVDTGHTWSTQAKAQPTATPTPVPTPTAAPTLTPTEAPTLMPAEEPAAEPTAEASAEPAAEPTAEASAEPAAEPTAEASAEPAAEPTAEASAEPAAEPTAEASAEPAAEPTAEASADLDAQLDAQLDIPAEGADAAAQEEPAPDALNGVEQATVEPTGTPEAPATPTPTVTPTATPTPEPTPAITPAPAAPDAPAIVLTLEDGCFTVFLPTCDQSEKHHYAFTATYNGEALLTPIARDLIVVSTNEAPALVVASQPEAAATTLLNDLPLIGGSNPFARLAGLLAPADEAAEPSAEEAPKRADGALDLCCIIHDKETPDGLAYTIEVLEGEVSIEGLEPDENGLYTIAPGDVKLLMVQVLSTGSVRVRITATDAGGLYVSGEWAIHTVSLTLVALIALAALVLLVLLIRLVMHLTRPTFAGRCIQVSQNGYAVQLPMGKALWLDGMTLAQPVIMAGLMPGAKLTTALLSTIRLEPMRRGRTRWTIGKKAEDVSICLDDGIATPLRPKEPIKDGQGYIVYSGKEAIGFLIGRTNTMRED